MRTKKPREAWVFRRFQPADSEAVRLVVHDTLIEFGLPPSSETDADLNDIELSYASGRFYVLTIGGIVKGCGGVRMIEPHLAEIRKMYFLPELRGLGAGAYLLDRLVNDARALGARRIVLETHSALKTAIALYERREFKTLASRKPNTPRCDTVMERVLDRSEP